MNLKIIWSLILIVSLNEALIWNPSQSSSRKWWPTEKVENVQNMEEEYNSVRRSSPVIEEYNQPKDKIAVLRKVTNKQANFIRSNPVLSPSYRTPKAVDESRSILATNNENRQRNIAHKNRRKRWEFNNKIPARADVDYIYDRNKIKKRAMPATLLEHNQNPTQRAAVQKERKANNRKRYAAKKSNTRGVHNERRKRGNVNNGMWNRMKQAFEKRSKTRVPRNLQQKTHKYVAENPSTNALKRVRNVIAGNQDIFRKEIQDTNILNDNNFKGYSNDENFNGYSNDNSDGYSNDDNFNGYLNNDNFNGYLNDDNFGGYSNDDNFGGYLNDDNFNGYLNDDNFNGYLNDDNFGGYSNYDKFNGYSDNDNLNRFLNNDNDDGYSNNIIFNVYSRSDGKKKLLDKLASKNLNKNQKRSPQTRGHGRYIDNALEYNKDKVYSKRASQLDAGTAKKTEKNIKRNVPQVSKRNFLDIITSNNKDDTQQVQRRDINSVKSNNVEGVSNKQANMKRNNVRLNNLENKVSIILKRIEQLREQIKKERNNKNNKHRENIDQQVEKEKVQKQNEAIKKMLNSGIKPTIPKSSKIENIANTHDPKRKRETKERLDQNNKFKNQQKIENIVNTNDPKFKRETKKERLGENNKIKSQQKIENVAITNDSKLKRETKERLGENNQIKSQLKIENSSKDGFQKSIERKQKHAKDMYKKFLSENNNVVEIEIEVDVKEKEENSYKSGEKPQQSESVKELDVYEAKANNEAKERQLGESENNEIGFIIVEEVVPEDTVYAMWEWVEPGVSDPFPLEAESIKTTDEYIDMYIDALKNVELEDVEIERFIELLQNINLNEESIETWFEMLKKEQQDNKNLQEDFEIIKRTGLYNGHLRNGIENQRSNDHERNDEGIGVFKAQQYENEKQSETSNGNDVNEIGTSYWDDDNEIESSNGDDVNEIETPYWDDDNEIATYNGDNDNEIESSNGDYDNEIETSIGDNYKEIITSNGDNDNRSNLKWAQTVNGGIQANELEEYENRESMKETKVRNRENRRKEAEEKKNEQKQIKQQEVEARKLQKQLINKKNRIKQSEGERLINSTSTPPCIYEQRRGVKNLCGCKFPDTCLRVYECTTPQCSFNHTCMTPVDARHICRPNSCKKDETCYLIQKGPKEFSAGCLLVDKNVVKPGSCPMLRNPYGNSETHNESVPCLTDSDCMEDKKCCQLKELSKKTCTDPVADISKPGLCPPKEFLDLLSDHQLCQKDVDCPQCLKCCKGETVSHCYRPLSKYEVERWGSLY